MEVLKEVISPGTYWYLDSADMPRKFDATPERIKHMHDAGKLMIAGGLSIPVPFEHQAEAVPMTAAEKAAKNLKENAGWVKDYVLKGDTLWANLDIQDDEIAKKLPKTIRYTSPFINTFMDGAGKKWDGVVTHVALTTRPRISKQSPFPTLAAAMSHAANLPSEQSQGFAISAAGRLVSDAAGLHPQHPLAFSMLSGIVLAAEEYIKEKKKKPEGKPGETPPAKGKPPGGEEEGEEEEIVGGSEKENPEGKDGQGGETPHDTDNDIGIHHVLCDLLDAAGISLPDDTDEKNFLLNAYMALMEKLKGEQMANDAQGAGKTPPNPIIQERPPYTGFAMSLEDIQKIADESWRNVALSLYHQNERLVKHEKNILEGAKKLRQARIDKLAAKMKPEAKDKLVALSGGMQFSLQDDGTVKDDMSAVLDILETGMTDIPKMLLGDPRSFGVTEQPKQFEGQITEERRKQVANGQLRMAGLEEIK